MNDLIEAIRAATGDGATPEQKAMGAQACRTILAALGAEPGKPIALPGAPQPHPLARLSLDQALDLVIRRLSTVADQREAAEKQPAAPQRGPQIAMVPAPARLPGARSARKKP